MFQETVKNIAAISVDTTLSQAAKDIAVQTQVNLLNEGLRTTTAVANTVPADIQNLNLDQFFVNTPTLAGA
jgi:endonuclease III